MSTLNKILHKLKLFGFDILRFRFYTKHYLRFKHEYSLLKSQLKGNKDFQIISPSFPCLLDLKSSELGHYFYQDLLVAQKIFKNNPSKHVDIGSRIDGFVASVASYRTIEVLDIRKSEINIENVIFKQCNVMEELNKDLLEYCDSLSCLHALEHFGLGRYGDPIDANGHIKGLENLYKILKPNGYLYLSLPIGKQKIEFNAHRIFSIEYLHTLFSNKFKLVTLDIITDKNEVLANCNHNFDSTCYDYACGIFTLKKI